MAEGMSYEEYSKRFLVDPAPEPRFQVTGTPGAAIYAEDAADQLDTKLQKLRRRSDDTPEGLRFIEEAIAHLRARDGDRLHPWTFEDGDGVRWFVLADRDDGEVVACYSTEPFIEADM